MFADVPLAVNVIDRYPYGILVEDVGGRLVAHNRAARRMLGDRWTLSTGSRIGCEILGCHRAGGPLADVCLHEQARAADGPLAEVRIKLPDGAGAEAAWVTLATLDPDRRLVLTELRPADRDDRRRRNEPGWRSGPHIDIFVLGRTHIMSTEGSLDGRWLHNRAGQVLKFLVAERHQTVYSDEIIERLWPNSDKRDARSLRYFVHVLRERLEPHGALEPPSSFVVATRGGYALDLARVWIDASAFEELVTAGLAAYARGDVTAALDQLTEGMELYRGDFLADERYADWAQHERDRLREIASNGLRVLAGHGERVGDLEAAGTSLRRLADLDPYDVDVHRGLLILHLRRGRYSEALRCYQALRRRMLTTFGEELDFALSELAVVGPHTRALTVKPPLDQSRSP